MAQVPYDPRKYLAIVDGAPVVDPADVDDAFRATYTDARVNPATGLYGAGANEINARTNSTFTIMTKGKSVDNARFALIDKLKRQVRIQFVNKNSNEEVASTRAAMVMTHPGVGGGNTQSDQTWVFSAPESELMPGGNKTAVL